MSLNLEFKFILLLFLLSIGLLFLFINLFYYILIILKANKYNLDIFYFKKNYNLFLSSKKIYKKIKKIINNDEFNLIIHKILNKQENPFNLKIINKFNNECIVCYDNSDDSNSDNTSLIIYEDEDNYMNDYRFLNNKNDEFLNNKEDVINNDLLKKYKEIYNYDSIKKKFVILNCGHKFHLNCITKWIKIKNECPLCKKNILIL